MTPSQEFAELMKEAYHDFLKMKLEEMEELDQIGFYNPIDDNWQSKVKFSTKRGPRQ